MAAVVRPSRPEEPAKPAEAAAGGANEPQPRSEAIPTAADALKAAWRARRDRS